MKLTPQQWKLLESLFPPSPSLSQAPEGDKAATGESPTASRGRPPVDQRLILQAILWKLSTNSPWYDLPPEYPSHQTCYRYYRQWKRSGLLDQVLRLLYQDLRDRGGLDLETALLDGAIQLSRRGRKWSYSVSPHLHGTWQLDTARIFIWEVIKVLRKNAPNN